MSIQQIKTFKDIQDAIITRAKLKDDTSLRNELKQKINEAQKALACEKPYSWSGESRPLVLKAKYATGTIAVTNGSHTITGTSTVWTELAHLNWKIKIGSQASPYTVKYVASNTSINIDPAFEGDTASGVSYTLYKDEYGLYPDCHELRKFQIPSYRRVIYPRGIDYVDDHRAQRPFLGGLPHMYSRHGKGVYHQKTWATFLLGTDFWEDLVTTDYPRNKMLVIYPAIFNEDRNAILRYTRVPPAMSEDAEEPLIPVEWRRILMLKVLKEQFLQNRDVATKREWEREYDALHKEMLSDIENTDEDTIFQVSRENNRFTNRWASSDDSRNW